MVDDTEAPLLTQALLQVDRRWLGRVSIPFATLYMNGAGSLLAPLWYRQPLTSLGVCHRQHRGTVSRSGSSHQPRLCLATASVAVSDVTIVSAVHISVKFVRLTASWCTPAGCTLLWILYWSRRLRTATMHFGVSGQRQMRGCEIRSLSFGILV